MMKSILKVTLLSALFILASCAHHKGCKGDSQCNMHKKDHSQVKSEQAETSTQEEAASKK